MNQARNPFFHPLLHLTVRKFVIPYSLKLIWTIIQIDYRNDNVNDHGT